MVASRKTSYRITNWKDYNESLVRRGDITFWFDDDVIDAWEHDNDEPKNGRPFTYSDTAIECLLMLRELFRLPYRQTEGLGRALAHLMQAHVAIPDYTSLAKRAAKLEIALDVAHRQGPIDIVVDSTGLKVFGEGEWKTRKHGISKRRTWRKLHLAINPETQEIEAEVLTENSGHDADQVDELIEQVDAPIDAFYGDGAYDQWKVYGRLAEETIEAIIPPRKNAKIKQHGNSSQPPIERDEAIRGIRRLGRKQWKKEVGYHRRSLAETAMFRMKCCFGDKLKNRELENQRTEARVRCKILNRFTHLGLPEFEWN
ncbi:MAG: IS5 family transposase [Planctomycetes bacterium]|nr:IS5 family transposase [Planctomycetota bacterium]